MLIEGILAAVPTPFYLDERVYFRKLEANVARYSRSLLSGILLLGSTGEAVALDDDESRDVLRVAAEAAAPEKVLIAGVGRESVKGTVELAEAAAQFRYDAVLVRTPTYYASQMSTAAVLHYFRSVADRSPLPVLLYNIPRCAPYDIPLEVIAELAQHPNIIGIKDSSGNLQRIGASVDASRNASRRTVTVTPIFEAVTGRMLTPKAESNGSFVSAGDLAGGVGVALASAPPAVPIKTRTREGAHRVGFHPVGGSSSRSVRGHPWVRSLRAAGLPGGLSGLEGSRFKAGGGETSAHCRPRAAYCRATGYRRHQAWMRLQWLLWRPATSAIVAGHGAGEG
jgi:4-hydroxy-2-oxoglutarate aldolase